MMKRIGMVLLIIAALFCSTACSTGTGDAKKEPANLTGEWKQVNSNSESTWQAAEIKDDTITVYWVSDNGDTKSLYWAGTYVAPTTADEPYSWDSAGDRSQMDSALLASQDETKTFTYENNQLSYLASAMGTTTTVRMEKQQ